MRNTRLSRFSVDTPLLLRLSVLALLVTALLFLWQSGSLAQLLDSFNRERVEAWVAMAGWWGPLLVIGLMTLAIVFTPIPSAPIGLAAGAAYGVGWGSVTIIAGAQCGALVAFGLARWLGRDVIRRWFGNRVDTGWLGSQNRLMAIVLVSRLLPFVSFDMVSYAAGLTVLRFWRFVVATLIGVTPVSVTIAWFGAQAMQGDPTRMTLAALGLGVLTGGSVLAAWWKTRRSGTS